MAIESDTPGILISTEGLNTEQIAGLRSRATSAAAEVGAYAVQIVAGGGITDRLDDAVEQAIFDMNYTQVLQWERLHRISVEDSRLELIQNPNTGVEIYAIKYDEIQEILAPDSANNSGPSVLGHFYHTRLPNALESLFNKRRYLREGAVNMGIVQKGDSDRFVRCWAITPGALYGLTLEQGEGERLGERTRANACKILEHMTDSPQEPNNLNC